MTGEPVKISYASVLYLCVFLKVCLLASRRREEEEEGDTDRQHYCVQALSTSELCSIKLNACLICDHYEG